MPAMLRELRRELRAAGYTIKSASEALGVGETTLKRWLSGKGLMLDKLEELCSLARTDMAEIMRRVDHPVRRVAHLTLAQETTLASDELLALLFFIILGGWAPDDLPADLQLPKSEIEKRLNKLERLALIDRLPGDRIRCRIDRKVHWRRHLMGAQFDRHMKRLFAEADYSSPQVAYIGEIVRLSPVGYGRLTELIERVRIEIQAIEEEDRRTTRLSGIWYATLFAARELDFRGARARAAEAQQTTQDASARAALD